MAPIPLKDRAPDVAESILVLHDRGTCNSRIADLLNLSPQTVGRFLISSGRRANGKPKRGAWSKTQILNAYLDGLTGPEIIQKSGIAQTTLYRTLQSFGVTRDRSKAQTARTFRNQLTTLPQELADYTDGLLLGDGSITNRHNTSATYRQTSVSLDWLEEIKKVFQKHEIPSKIRRRKLELHHKNQQYNIYTKSLVMLLQQRHRWYPKGIKIIPTDLTLTPTVARLWLLGDGTRQSAGLAICCESFTVRDVEFLSHLLKITCNVDPRHSPDNRLHLKRDDAQMLLTYAREAGSPPESLKYRWWIGTGESQCCLG